MSRVQKRREEGVKKVKVRRVKKSVVCVSMGLLFLITYAVTYKNIESANELKRLEKEALEGKGYEGDVIPKDELLDKLMREGEMYISNGVVSNIEMEAINKEDMYFILNEAKKIRKLKELVPKYEGYTVEGIRFETDLDVFRLYSVTEEMYYKIPVSRQEELKEILDKNIYTSFDFIKQYETWKEVKVKRISDGKSKSVLKWKFDDLSYKFVEKRVVGKVQPEKSRLRNKGEDYIIEVEAKGYNIIIETMGKDYVKLTTEGAEAYYEVPQGLYEYLEGLFQ